MEARYFAYGSNLSLDRMLERVPGARPLGVGRLSGHRFTWNKRGADGSGKANLRIDPAADVWGVVYAFDEHLWPELDAFEPGYERLVVSVELDHTAVRSSTYRSARITTALPYSWYQRLVVEGARAHGLPEPWVRELVRSPSQPDARP